MQIPGIDPEKLSNYERQLAGLRLECELLSMRLWLRGFHPDQLRVPAGNPDGGEWTIGGTGAGSGHPHSSIQLAVVINVCILSGASRFVDSFGNKSYAATYDCRGGQSFRIEGRGDPPDLVRDPFF